MSWFTVPDALKDLKATVESAIPKIDGGSVLEKLTLTSPELLEERRRIDEEEKRKERVRDLISLLPWETRDPERDILVEECREAILKLSSDKQVFSGPFHLPKPSVNLWDSEDDGSRPDKAANEGEIEHEEGDRKAKSEKEPPQVEPPTDASLEKLRCLEPLPRLLRDFELDAHVGLIQKLLQADPELVRMQSSLSGGGDHEKVFWKNYFFHCAWCRYEAGLSIDEIWSDHPQPASQQGPTGRAASAGGEGREDANEEETITFDSAADEAETEKAFPGEPATDPNAPFRNEGPSSSSATDPSTAGDGAPVSLSVTGLSAGAAALRPSSATEAAAESADFELVGGVVGPDNDDDAIGADYELDALEAEIARELED
jgi:hypothetical protein